MSQTNSPWSDKARLNALRENFNKPYEYSPNLSIASNAVQASTNSNDSNTTRREQNTFTSASPGLNVKSDPQFRKWRNFYTHELGILYDLFINELKKISPETKEKLKNKFEPNNFYLFIYKHTSPGLRKI